MSPYLKCSHEAARFIISHIAKIEELTGIKRRPTQVRKFLKSIGMRHLKVGMVPSKADPEERETFKKTLGTPFRRRKIW